MSLRKIASWTAFAMVVLYLVHSPEDAAQLVLSGGSALAVAGSSLASFVASLV
jgi:hypothetical protein